MPYLPNAIRERMRWTPLACGIEQICNAEACRREEALRQLRLAIADGNVPVCWADLPEGPSARLMVAEGAVPDPYYGNLPFLSIPSVDSETPPADEHWWQTAEVRIGADASNIDLPIDEYLVYGYEPGLESGFVLDDWCLESYSRPQVGVSAVVKWIREIQEPQRRFFIVRDEVRFRPLLVERKAINQIWGWWPSPIIPPIQENYAEPPRPGKKASIAEVRALLIQIYETHKHCPPNLNECYSLVKPHLPNASRRFVHAVAKEPEFTRQRFSAGVRKRRPKAPSQG
jgi:hypothetical protein